MRRSRRQQVVGLIITFWNAHVMAKAWGQAAHLAAIRVTLTQAADEHREASSPSSCSAPGATNRDSSTTRAPLASGASAMSLLANGTSVGAVGLDDLQIGATAGAGQAREHDSTLLP